MKKFIVFLVVVVSFISLSCNTKPELCTSEYSSELKIDGKKGEEVSVEYIGPKERKYEREFMFRLTLSENKLPFFNVLDTKTICQTDDFKKNNYDFLKIKNLGTEDMYIFAIIEGPETKEFTHLYHYRFLLRIYGKQDRDPNYDYRKSKEYQNTSYKYIDRYELYEKLLEEKYPYIIKLPPQKTCIMKWGGFGFKVL